MNKTKFNLGSDNIIEKYFELIDVVRVSSKNTGHLDEFELHLDKLAHRYKNYFLLNDDPKAVEIILEKIESYLKFFFDLFEKNGVKNDPFLKSFFHVISFFSILLKVPYASNLMYLFHRNFDYNFSYTENGDHLLRQNISKTLVKGNFATRRKRIGKINKAYNREKIESLRHRLSVEYIKSYLFYGIGSEKINLVWNDTLKKFDFQDIGFEVLLGIDVYSKNDRADQLIKSLYSILSGLSVLNNIELEFESIESGSIYSRIRVYMKNLAAKDEFKEIMQSAKEVVIKKIGDVSHFDTQKKIVESENSKLQTELLKKEIESKPSDTELKQIIALDLEKKALENEKLRIQNAKEKLEVIKSASELIANGVIESEGIRMTINEVKFLFINNVNGENDIPDINIEDMV